MPEVSGRWDEIFARHTLRLTRLAYQVLGDWHRSEDVVQEAMLRCEEHKPDNPAAWLSRVTVRLAIDEARVLERSKENYVGEWLPDFVAWAAADTNVEEEFDVRDDVDSAITRLVQVLSPVDRAVIVLMDVMGFPSADVARLLSGTPASVRQRASRARAKLRKLTDQQKPQGDVRAVRGKDVRDLAALLNEGKLEEFVSRLSEGAVLWTDFGGHGRAARRPIFGAERIRRFLIGIFSKYGLPQFSVRSGVGADFLVAESSDMERWVVIEQDSAGRIVGVQVQQNPEKRLVAEPSSCGKC